MAQVKPALRHVGTTLLKDLTIKIGRHRARILPMLVSIANREWKKSNSPVDYHDVVSEAVLGALKAGKAYRKVFGTKVSTFTYTRALFAVKDYIRREAVNAKKHLYVDPVSLRRCVSVDGIEERLIAKELFDQVRQVVCRELTPKHAAVLVMYYLQEKSETEIAETLQCSSNKVSKVKTKALAEARIAMQKRGHYVLVAR